MTQNPNYYQIFSVWKLHWQCFLRLCKCEYRPSAMYWGVMCYINQWFPKDQSSVSSGLFSENADFQTQPQDIFFFLYFVALKQWFSTLAACYNPLGAKKHDKTIQNKKNPDTSAPSSEILLWLALGHPKSNWNPESFSGWCHFWEPLF